MSNPVPLAERTPTDPFEAVDADLALLHTLDPVDQVPVFGRVHAALTTALAATAGTTSTPPGAARPAAPGQPHRGGR